MKGWKRQRPSGSWEIGIRARDPETGARRQWTRTVHGSATQADRELRRLVDDHESGTLFAERAGGTVAGLVAGWVDRKSDEWAPKTEAGYRGIVARDLGDLGDVQLEELRPVDIEEHVRVVARSKGVPTGRALHRMLSAAFNDAYRLDLVARNPMAKVRAPKLVRRETTTVTVDQLRHAAAAADPLMTVVVRLAAITGCRAGELCGIRWSDVHASDLFVSRSVDVTVGAPRLKATKSGRAKLISLDAETVRVLDGWRASQQAASGKRWTGEWFVLGGETPARPDGISARWRKLRGKVGLGEVRLHDLRHASATTMVAAGVDPVTAAQRLGHSPEVLLSVYAGAVRERDRAAAEILAAALDG